MGYVSKTVMNNILVLVTLAYLTSRTLATNTTDTLNGRARSLLKNSDAYVQRNQRECLESRSLVACIKYKASKIVWKLATNSMGYFPQEFGRELRDDKRRIRFIQLGEPSDISIFPDARSFEGV